MIPYQSTFGGPVLLLGFPFIPNRCYYTISPDVVIANHQKSSKIKGKGGILVA